MTQRGRKSTDKQLLVLDRDNPIAKPAPPPHFDKPERDLWRLLTAENNFFTSTSLAMLAVAMEAHALMRRCHEQIVREEKIRSEGSGRTRLHQLLDTLSRAVKQYVTAMKQLKVLR